MASRSSTLRKTPAMLVLEHHHGKPIEELLDTAHGNRQLARLLSTPTLTVDSSTIFRWRKQLAA